MVAGPGVCERAWPEGWAGAADPAGVDAVGVFGGVAKEEAEKKTAQREAERRAEEARDLNGGSVPAPSQRAPGH